MSASPWASLPPSSATVCSVTSPAGSISQTVRGLLSFWTSSSSDAAPAAAQTAISVDAGTLGAGVEVGHAFNERFDGRLGVAAWTVSGRRKVADIDYEAKGELRSAQLFADWHPGASAFRLSAGVF